MLSLPLCRGWFREEIAGYEICCNAFDLVLLETRHWGTCDGVDWPSPLHVQAAQLVCVGFDSTALGFAFVSTRPF